MDHLKVFEGVPPAYETVKRLVVPDALKVLRLQHGHKSVKLGDLASTVSSPACPPCCVRYLTPGLQSSLHSEQNGAASSVLPGAKSGICWYSGCKHAASAGLQVGWKHQDAVKELEEKRKVRSAAYYEQKKKLNVLRIKAAAE